MRAPWIAVALLATGCLFRNAPEPRFFRPASAALGGALPRAPVSSEADGSPLRLRPVRAIPLLRERIVWRASPIEYGLYEQRRWTELPATYVERALEGALRATPGVRLTDRRDAATLRVEVLAFDEVWAPAREAAVSLAVTLVDPDGRRSLDRTFDAAAPIADPSPAATAIAMGQALDEVASAVASAVGGRLRGR
jgi:ABC-type uncharacterized transport system auxiliary subunit